MVFQKYNGANNAIAFLDAPITNVSNTLTLNGGYDRFPTTNFIVSVVQYDVNNEVEFRENMLISTRSGNICNIQTRKFELVPENENSQGSVQESYAFEVGSTVELTVSNAFIEDIQDEVTDLWNRVTTNEDDITTLQADKSDKSNVLELDNTDSYTPTNDYHPATKKYVDSRWTNIKDLPQEWQIEDFDRIIFYDLSAWENKRINAADFFMYGISWGYISSINTTRDSSTSLSITWQVLWSVPLQAKIAMVEVYMNDANEVNLDLQWVIFLDWSGISQIRWRAENGGGSYFCYVRVYHDTWTWEIKLDITMNQDTNPLQIVYINIDFRR